MKPAQQGDAPETALLVFGAWQSPMRRPGDL